MPDETDDLLADLLLQWEELNEQGRDVPAEELCADNPHLTAELARRIDALKATAWLDTPITSESLTGQSGYKPGEPRTLAGRYRLDSLIAEGGFAQVWRSYDLELQRVVAVKVPKPNRLQSADTFMAEARRVARLKHPGIVPVHDVGREGESCFIVSEFVEGGSLADHLKNSPPSQQQAIRWVIEIADALEYAHLHGVIHRDVKPGNILIDHHGRALLADFGIAQSANKAGKEALSLGTLRYMSPEQLDGKTVDPRADIFSLGMVLLESLTGKLPYSSVEPSILRREIAAGIKMVTAPGLPAEVRRICQKTLEHDPLHRYGSAAQVAAELRRYSGSPRSTWRWWVAAAAIAILASGAFVWWNSGNAERRNNDQSIPDQWVQHVSRLPASQQLALVAEKLRELNPTFDGKLTGIDGQGPPKVDDGVVTELGFLSDTIADISPVRALTGLKSLVCRGSVRKKTGKVTDLGPLQRLPLTSLDVADNGKLVDLGPLRGLGLEALICSNTSVADLSPLAEMKLTKLTCFETKIRSLAPLLGMPLRTLDVGNTAVSDLSPLRGSPLHDLRVCGTAVSDLSPVRGMGLLCLWCDHSKVTDLTPLEGMKLVDITISPKIITKGMDIIRTMPSMRTIRVSPIEKYPAREFWRKYDAREFGGVPQRNPSSRTAAEGSERESALALGRIHFDRGEWDKAEAAFTEAITLNPESAEAHHRRAGSFYNAGKVKESLPDFDVAARLDPTNAEILKNRSFVYLKLLRVDEALADLRRAQELDPDHPELYRKPMSLALAQRGYVKAQANKVKEAVADMDEALRLDPTNAEVFDKRGSLQHNLKHFKEAVADFTEAIRLDPQPAFYLHRGFAHEALGMKTEAAEDYKRGRPTE